MKKKLTLILSGIVFSFSTVLLSQDYHNQKIYFKNDSIISALVSHVNEDSVQSYIQALENMGTRFMMSPNRKNVAGWIKDKFISFGLENARIDSVLCYTQIDLWNLHYDTTTWQYNVVGTIPGIENEDSYYVIGAHYDNVVVPDGNPIIYAPGADDNASGVAALLEIARIFNNQNYYPKTSIEFIAFGAEELMNYGNCGSEGYVNQAISNEMDIQLMINNDMIANSNGSDWKIRISNYVNNEWLTEMAVNITEQFTEIEPYLLEPSSNGSADCRYFYQAGIPCVYFMEKDFNTFYHTENDLVANCEINYCSEAIKISLGVLVKSDNPVTEITELYPTSTCTMFPNPCDEILFIRIPDKLVQCNPSLSIYDIYGKEVYRAGRLAARETSIDVRGLVTGIYIVQVVTLNGKETAMIQVR